MNDDVSTLRDSGTLLGERRPAPITGDRYRLGAVIGAGGMGEVLAARDLQIGRDVAIKRMKAQDPTDAQIARFEREAQIQGRLEHPAIVPVHETGRDTDGRPYFVMKKLAGRTLGELMEESPAPRARMLRAFIDVCLAVELAHTRGIVHRDLKPDNIVLGDFGEVYVLDWGVARVIGDQSDIASISADDNTTSGPMTVAGAAVGTPGYMPPEQIAGDPKLDARADVYALGCVLFEILAGEALHPRGPAGMMSASQGLADLSPARRAPAGEVPPELDALCIRATALAPADRIATARELGDRVQQYLDGDRDVAARRTLAVRHHADAVQALERGEQGQSIAMREAGRALALDPTLTSAADLVGRLMLEPPREVPQEVHVEMEAEERRGLAAFARQSVPTYLAYVVLVPALVRRAPTLEIAVVLGAIVASMAVLYTIGRMRMASMSPLLWVGTGMLAVLTHLLSPVVVMPLLVINGMVLAALMPGKSARLRIALAMFVAIGVPWLGEVAGVLPATFAIDGAGGHVFPPLLLGDPTFTIAFFVTSVAAVIVSAVLVADALRRQHATARLALHLQAWRLRQLAPL